MPEIQGISQQTTPAEISASQRIAASRVHNTMRELNERSMQTVKAIKNVAKTVQHRGIELIGPNKVDITI